jgi:hypothetical protein
MSFRSTFLAAVVAANDDDARAEDARANDRSKSSLK